ncbi:MAG: class I SAM-dependent methyltransferase [Rhodocyclaceae bacterium]|nr:MAG: class I SAM-dependent methyltransferase [Rhodocyclaceae bacterium]
MDNCRLLIFPLDLDDADPVIRVAKSLGIEVIGASSAMPDSGQRGVDHFLRLPFVTDPAFDAALQEVLHRHRITAVFSPHQGVWRHLEKLAQASPQTYGYALCGPDPFTATWQLFSPHESWAATVGKGMWAPTPAARPALSPASYAALHRLFISTPGQCDEGKLHALCDIARSLPVGDLLEVGCLYGRSAIALGFLAARHRIGSLICVDPWETLAVTDQGAQAALLNTELKSLDSQEIFRIFISTAALVDNIGYIRHTSAAAQAIYEAAKIQGSLSSAELGSISLAPALSLLHIDGNHRYDFVKQDVAIWSPYLAEGGWLLLDDYVWAFGDGPKRVGDELLDSPCWDNAFVSGDTLFLRRTAAPLP